MQQHTQKRFIDNISSMSKGSNFNDNFKIFKKFELESTK